MVEILAYIGLGLVIVVVEIQHRLEKVKVERLENLWFQVSDVGSNRVVADHSLKMLEELTRFESVEWFYMGMMVKVYRKGEGGRGRG